MPAPNDLTPEEEQAFVQHGVQPAGPGMEPTGEVTQPAPEPTNPHADRTPASPQRDEQGRFAAPAPPAPPADPNAPPAPDANAQPAPPPGFVPHAALHAERLARQEAARLAQVAQTRMNAMLAAQQQQAQQPAPLPDLEEDPVGYIRAMEERLARFEGERQEQQQYRQIDSAIDQDEQMFAAQVPDYNQAMEHYVRSRSQELLHFNSPEQVQQIMVNEARQMAQMAWQRGLPAAQMVYQMAQARGYQPGQAAAPQPGFTAPQAVPQAALTPQQQVAAINAGQAATRTLSGGSGSAAPAELNAEAILQMTDEQFAEYMKLGQKGSNERFAAFAGR